MGIERLFAEQGNGGQVGTPADTQVVVGNGFLQRQAVEGVVGGRKQALEVQAIGYFIADE